MMKLHVHPGKNGYDQLLMAPEIGRYVHHMLQLMGSAVLWLSPRAVGSNFEVGRPERSCGQSHSTLGGTGSMPLRKILKIYIALD